MKKGICFLGMLIVFMLCAISARADVIWEPEDDFYEKHSSECTYNGRQFIADGPDGKVILYKSPESSKEVATWENGYKVSISFTYEDEQGIVWGFPAEWEDKRGWMPMEYMQVVYDTVSFEEEHSGQIEQRDGVLDESYKDDTIYFWKYPGSEEGNSVNMQDWDNMPGYSSVYTDEEGRSWGNVGYFYGYRDSWICLDNPTAEFDELYPDGAPQAEVKDDEESSNENIQQAETQGEENQIAEQTNTERIKPQTNQSLIVITILLVAAVVLVTIVLLVLLKRRK